MIETAKNVVRGLSISWLLWLALVMLAFLTAGAFPLCYLPSHIEEMAAHNGLLRRLLEGLQRPPFHLLTVDRSCGSVLCVLLFAGVLIRYRECCQRLQHIREDLATLCDNPSAEINDQSLSVLRKKLRGTSGAQKKFVLVQEFHEKLQQESQIDQFESYLVAIGLIGTLLAFYLGFAEKLQIGLTYRSLDATARELLTVVGTAAVSSVVGIGLGMIFVRALSDRLEAFLAQVAPLERELVK